ncbi:MAG: 3-isopropylmalate dehydratase small subunit [Pseudomonadota bacterium]
MNAFDTHRGIAVAFLTHNIDTDAIIPSREMKRVSKEGLGEGLFANWRYAAPDDRTPRADFALNQAPTNEASILLSGRNFGCGSSREHAVWALAEFGFRAIIAESFGAIFQKNCIANGILTAEVDTDGIAGLAQWCADDPAQHQLHIDLRARVISGPTGKNVRFNIAESDARKLLSGLDPITETLADVERIDRFEADHLRRSPWVDLSTDDAGT